MVWTIAAFVAVCAGHTEVWVTLVNRLNGLPLASRTHDRLRRVHEAMVLLVPVAIVLGPGWSAPRRFLEGDWSGLELPWIAFFVLCGLGLAGLLLSVATWWLRTRKCMSACQSRRVIAAPRTSLDPSAAAFVPLHLQILRRVPGNQQFQIEINEKTLTPSHWPDALDGLSILHLSDWHLCPTYPREFFETAAGEASRLPADLVAFTGDLFDDLRCLDWLDSTLDRLVAPLGRFFILGNHDSWLDHDLIRERMSERQWIDLAGRVQTIETGRGPLLLGGDETPWFGTRPPLGDYVHCPRLLMAHTPDSFPWAAAAGIDVMLAGHNHGGQVILPGIGPIYSPSVYGCRYPSGVYSHARTVMHVSRGLAGRHPLRIGSRPEITRLTIRSATGHTREPYQHAAQSQQPPLLACVEPPSFQRALSP